MPWQALPLLALALPVTLGAAALLIPRRAGPASGVALALALLFAAGAALVGTATPPAAATFGVRVDPATCVMLVLVAALGAVVVRFSLTYLSGDPRLVRYLRWLLLTLSAVATLVVANDLLVMAVAWTATSLSLHQLLTFHSERPAALIAAHKKFLVSRLADAFLAASLALLYANVGSFDLDRIAAWVGAHPGLSASMQAAALLLVIAVALRSAQLPFHGWITQVMEAPTPVSALLHAGVVNVGGFVLIRLAPWISQAEPARLLLIAIGLVTATAAALVMTTRVSVKVALAWSTCAQMGFMLVQCGLGLWPLALLHLVAHSLYKAHAFLNAGSVVEDWRTRAMSAARPPVAPLQLLLAAAAPLGCALLALALVPALRGRSSQPHELVLALLLGLSLVPLLAAGVVGGAWATAARAPRVVLIVALSLGCHALAGHVVSSPAAPAGALSWGLVGCACLGLFALKSVIQLWPGGSLARSLHPWLFSGLFLDELFTRVTFRVWPPRLPQRAVPAPATRSPALVEVRA